MARRRIVIVQRRIFPGELISSSLPFVLCLAVTIGVVNQLVNSDDPIDYSPSRRALATKTLVRMATKKSLE